MLASITRPPTSMRHRCRPMWARLAAVSCAVLLAACSGGSGSSGFDVSAENTAIDTALATQDCTVNDGLTICPSGAEVPTSSPSPSATVTMPVPQVTATAQNPPTSTSTPPRPMTASATPTFHLTETPTRTPTSPPTLTPTTTPIPSPQVITNLGSSTVVPCVASSPTAPCLFEFMFQPQGFAASTTFAVAFRTRNPDSDWQIVTPTATPTGFSAIVPVDPGAQYQFAVLVFVGGDGRTAPSVDALGQTDATFAFVTPGLTTEEVTP